MSGNSRLIQFDILKGIGIACVLLGHTGIPQWLSEQIYAFHMPLFFFCSGFFFRNKPLRETVANSTRRLLIPWLFFVIVLYASLSVLYLIDGGIVRFVSEILLTTNPLDEHCQLFNTVWFLVALFEVRVLYAALNRVIMRDDTTNGLIILLALCAIGYFLALFLRLPLFLDTAIGMLIYYHCGRLFFDVGLFKKNLNWYWITLMFLLYVVLVRILHPHVEIKDCIYPVYHVFIALLGIYALYQVCMKMDSHRHLSNWLSFFGASSLSLLGFHRPLWLFVYPICLNLSLSWWIIILVQMISACLFILPIDRFLKKHTPFLIGG